MAQSGQARHAADAVSPRSTCQRSRTTGCPAKPTPPENVVDWNLWLGPAPWRPYNQQYVEGGWRGYYDFDSGANCSTGAPTPSTCANGPTRPITPCPSTYEPSDKNITCLYENGVKLILDFLPTPFGDRSPNWITRLGTCPVRFVGDEGWVETGDSGEIEVSSDVAPQRTAGKAAKVKGLDVSAHARNFFDCVKSRQPTVANPDVMRHSHIACHAAALSWILQRKLSFDPVKDEFVGDDEANGLRSRPAAQWS